MALRQAYTAEEAFLQGQKTEVVLGVGEPEQEMVSVSGLPPWLITAPLLSASQAQSGRKAAQADGSPEGGPERFAHSPDGNFRNCRQLSKICVNQAGSS